MPQGRSGISATTAPNMVLDAGEVWFNIGITELEGAGSDPWDDATSVSGAVKVGGTRGGSVFNPGRTLREIPVDGSLGPVKGYVRRQRSAPTLTVNALEITEENVEYAIAGADNATKNTFQMITGGEIEDADYIDNVALATTLKGADHPIVIVLHNVMVMEAPEWTLTDSDELVLNITFTAHTEVDDPNVEAFAIYHPGTVAAPS